MTASEYNNCVSQYADNVYRFIVKNLRHEEDARDIVQTAFEKMWRNRDAVEPAKSKSYLFTVAYNQMIDHIRKNKRIQLKDEFSEETSVQIKGINNAKQILNEALNRPGKSLSAPRKAVFEKLFSEQRKCDVTGKNNDNEDYRSEL